MVMSPTGETLKEEEREAWIHYGRAASARSRWPSIHHRPRLSRPLHLSRSASSSALAPLSEAAARPRASCSQAARHKREREGPRARPAVRRPPRVAASAISSYAAPVSDPIEPVTVQSPRRERDPNAGGESQHARMRMAWSRDPYQNCLCAHFVEVRSTILTEMITYGLLQK